MRRLFSPEPNFLSLRRGLRPRPMTIKPLILEYAAASFVTGDYVKNIKGILKLGWLPIEQRRDLNLLKQKSEELLHPPPKRIINHANMPILLDILTCV